MAFGKKKGETPKSESGASQAQKLPDGLLSFTKFQLVDNGFNKAKIDTFVDHRDGKTYPELDKEGRKTVYLEKKVRDKVIITAEDAAILNDQATNTKIIYLLSDKEEQFDHPFDPKRKMFNIVNQIGK